MDGTQGKFCKKVLRIRRNEAKREAESELVRESRRGNILCAAIKYWISLKADCSGGIGETALRLTSWTAGQGDLTEEKELESVCRTWLHMTECERDRNKDHLKHSWEKGEYTARCTMKEKSGIACFRLRIWKPKGRGGEGVEGQRITPTFDMP